MKNGEVGTAFASLPVHEALWEYTQMSDVHGLTVEVVGADIIVRNLPGTDNQAIYHKSNGAPQLSSKDQIRAERFPRACVDARQRSRERAWLAQSRIR